MKFGTGVLVGPRHVLTSSHNVDWDFPIVNFRAHQWGNDFNLTNNWSTDIWHYEKILPTYITPDNIVKDFVVCVLDEPVGEWLGWMGTTTFKWQYENSRAFQHCGYTDNVPEGSLLSLFPTHQEGVLLEFNNLFPRLDFRALTSQTGDMLPGHSGGPVFGWWYTKDARGNYAYHPHAVGFYSGGPYCNRNWFAGAGTAMVNLIELAKAQHP